MKTKRRTKTERHDCSAPLPFRECIIELCKLEACAKEAQGSVVTETRPLSAKYLCAPGRRDERAKNYQLPQQNRNFFERRALHLMHTHDVGGQLTKCMDTRCLVDVPGLYGITAFCDTGVRHRSTENHAEKVFDEGLLERQHGQHLVPLHAARELRHELTTLTDAGENGGQKKEDGEFCFDLIDWRTASRDSSSQATATNTNTNTKQTRRAHAWV